MKIGPSSNMEISQQVTKYCGKEEKLLEGAISPLFHNILISNFGNQITYS